MKNLFNVIKCSVVVMMAEEEAKFYGTVRMRSLHYRLVLSIFIYNLSSLTAVSTLEALMSISYSMR